METKDLEYFKKLEEAVLLAVGASSGKLYDSGWVLSYKTYHGKRRKVFINERDDIRAKIFSFSSEWMAFVKDHKQSLIAVVETNNPEHIIIIDPEDDRCGYTLLLSQDEMGDKVYNFHKTIGMKK